MRVVHPNFKKCCLTFWVNISSHEQNQNPRQSSSWRKVNTEEIERRRERGVEKEEERRRRRERGGEGERHNSGHYCSGAHIAHTPLGTIILIKDSTGLLQQTFVIFAEIC